MSREEDKKTRIAFKDLDHDALREGFNSCRATPENRQARIDRLRFKIGDRVECAFSDGWKPGVVVAHLYRNETFPPGKTVPYQIRLDGENELIFAPFDDDRCIRRKLSDVERRTLVARSLAANGMRPDQIAEVMDVELAIVEAALGEIDDDDDDGF